MNEPHEPFLIEPQPDETPLAAAERGLRTPRPLHDALAELSHVAQGDPFLAQQLADLRRTWEVQPPPARGLFARLRTRLAWWLLEPELRQINMVHATLSRIAESLVMQIDAERAARRRFEEREE
jgi:hypothetical protein